MGFYIQDDYFEAMKGEPTDVQNQFFGAIVRFYFTGEEPKRLDPRARLAFDLVKKRVKVSIRKSETWKAKKGNADNLSTTEVEPGINSSSTEVEPKYNRGSNEVETDYNPPESKSMSKSKRVKSKDLTKSRAREGGEVFDEEWFDKYK